MKIETKYNIDDQIYFMDSNKIKTGFIWTIHFYETRNGRDITKTEKYHINGYPDWYSKDQLFKTKEELIVSL